MKLFECECSLELALALGAKPYVRDDRGHSFAIYNIPDTYHACLRVNNHPYAWFWLLDKDHPTIEVL